MTPRLANLLTALGLVGLVALVSLTSPRWARYIRQPLGAVVEEPAPSPAAGSTTSASPPPGSEPTVEAQRTINVKLFFEAADRPGLVMEDRSVSFSQDLSGQIRRVVEELIKGSQTKLVAPLNPATRVLEVFVTAQGIAYVDLSKDVTQGVVAGSAGELLAVYSVVDSITENFPAIRRVQILVEDRPAETLAGHVDVSRPLTPDLTLLAAAAVRPADGPSPAPEGSPPPS